MRTLRFFATDTALAADSPPSSPPSPAPEQPSPPAVAAPEAVAPPAAESPKPAIRVAPNMGRAALREAYRRAAAPATPAASEEPTSQLSLGRTPETAPPAAPTPEPAAPSKPPANETPAASESPASAPATSAPAPAEPPASEPAPQPPARTPLPEDFQHDLEELGTKDPSLRRTLSRIWNNHQLTEGERIRQMDRKVQASRAAPTPVSTERRMADAAREGRYEDLAEQALRIEQERDQQLRSFALSAEIIADVAGLDPDDPDYLRAANPTDLRGLIARKSTLISDALSTREKELTTAHQAELATVRKEYEDRMVELRKQFEEEKKAAVTQATAQAEAGRPVQPRGFGPTGAGEAGGPNVPDARDPAAAVRLRRNLLATGFRQTARAAS